MVTTLIGDLCFLSATADLRDNWENIKYDLPPSVCPLVDTCTIATDGSRCYRVSTSKETKEIYIHRVEEGEKIMSGTISFTLF